ncbi:hypothetical protein HC028_19785 [Planosporangium flavigriseum]|uniref:Uncharacterized protein n=1 Tax=Planosporangium flavigriseum TaxID=373681 RepID=A0A8J3LWK0_9ACTN|nr:hypothetical protein [Planosporangium flavigriseum]NJC66732.1 hypothetical protein [Planosporangium flavigriseum]GIG74886.1 hypothetical protein Pfl04_32900 [Planosporangium flavigriseum]
MAVLGSVVRYIISATDEEAIRRRASFGPATPVQSPPVAGDELPALVTKHYGAEPGVEVVDLMLELDGVGAYWVGAVRQGNKGEPGSWW